MSDLVHVTQAPAQGMVTLRADLSDAALAARVAEAVGVPLPEARQVTQAGAQALAWMSPDELMWMLPHAEAAAGAQAARKALEGAHVLVVDVSDARAVFTLEGAWHDVVARLSPMDLGGFGPGEIRRTRFAQVPAALWQSGEAQARVMCFRSVAGYMQQLLSQAAAGGALAPEE